MTQYSVDNAPSCVTFEIVDTPDTPKFVPKFLQASQAELEGAVDPSAAPATQEQLFELQTKLPTTSLTFYQKELARLLSLGKKPKDVAEQMKCSLQYVYACMKHPLVIAEAERYRDRLFEGDVADRLKELNSDAFRVAEQLIRDSDTKPNLRWDAAKWILEKTTGKAIQAIDVQSSSLEAFHKLLTDMSARGEALDVTPTVEASEVTGELEAGFDAQAWADENT